MKGKCDSGGILLFHRETVVIVVFRPQRLQGERTILIWYIFQLFWLRWAKVVLLVV